MSDARWSRVAVADAAVELVMSRRGKPKAKYAGRTFTLDTRNGQRYRWRCDVRQCRSRLTTDLYENHHMVYRFRDHDEDQHRRVVSERKRRDATYRQQRAKKIGDFRYVLENRIGGLRFWRCEHVSCPGRCRTHDGLLVAGPSQHTHGPHAAADEPDTAHDGEDSSSCKEFQLDACEQAPPGVGEATTADMDPKRREVSLQQYQQERSSQISTGSVDSPVVIKSEPCSPLTPEAATTSDVGFSAVDETAQTHGPDVITDATTTAGDDGPLFRVSSPFICPDQRRSSQTAYDETPTAAAAAAPEASNYVDSSDYEGNDEEEQSPRRSVGAAVISEVMGERSHWTAAAGYGLAASGRSSGLAEVLQMTAHCADSRERDLRVEILLQMRRLLEAEADLVNERRRNEVLRGKLLRRQLLGIETESEPAPPYI